MRKIVRWLLAVVLGFALGSVVNMGLLTLGGRLIAPPAGADVSTLEGLKVALPLFEPKHFLFPFLAHALGTLVGAGLAAGLAAARAGAAAIAVTGSVPFGRHCQCADVARPGLVQCRRPCCWPTCPWVGWAMRQPGAGRLPAAGPLELAPGEHTAPPQGHRMACLHFFCGKPGAGKTTLALQLAHSDKRRADLRGHLDGPPVWRPDAQL